MSEGVYNVNKIKYDGSCVSLSGSNVDVKRYYTSNHPRYYHRRLFQYNVEEGRLREIKKSKLSLEDVKSDNNFALRHAVYNGRLKILKFLLKTPFVVTNDSFDVHEMDGARTDQEDWQLMYAIKNSKFKLIDEVIDHSFTIIPYPHGEEIFNELEDGLPTKKLTLADVR